MSCATIARHISQAASRFGSANEGNIAVIFGIVILPVLAFVGAAIDYSRANMARSSMQAAMDSTALMLSRDLTQGLITPSQITTKAQAYFSAMFFMLTQPSQIASAFQQIGTQIAQLRVSK